MPAARAGMSSRPEQDTSARQPTLPPERPLHASGCIRRLALAGGAAAALEPEPGGLAAGLITGPLGRHLDHGSRVFLFLLHFSGHRAAGQLDVECALDPANLAALGACA